MGAMRFAVCAAATLLLSPGSTHAGEPNWPDHLNIGSASPGGTYYVYGEGVAKILTRALNLPVGRMATEGPAQNIDLLEAGEARLGFVTMGIALQAWNATGIWQGKKPARDMRAIFPMYDTPFQVMVLQETPIRSIGDLAGKRVGVGPHGGTTAAYFPQFFDTLKLQASFVFGDWSELADELHARQIDVLAVGAGVPFPSFTDLERSDKVRYIAFDAQQIAALRLAMPELAPSRVPAGTYPSLLRAYQTIGLYNFAVAHAQLPNDLVYTAVRAVFDSHEELIAAHTAAAATVPANMDRNTFLPLHPGAIRYYAQIGKLGTTD